MAQRRPFSAPQGATVKGVVLLLLLGQLGARASARVTRGDTNTWPWSGGGGVEEGDGGSLADRSGQIIKQQDAEEGKGWDRAAWSPRLAAGWQPDILCPKPLPPDNGYTRGVDYNDGGVVRVLCEAGYRLSGPPTLTCTPVPRPGAPGVWLPRDEYRCLPSGPSVVEVRSLGGGSNEAAPRYTVFTDHVLHHTDEAHQHQDTQPSAADVRCPRPSPPRHGRLQGADYSLYATVRVTCDKSYTLIGPDHMNCLPDPNPFHHAAMWEPQQAPSCHAPPPSTLPLILLQGLTLSRAAGPQTAHRPTDTLPDAPQAEGLSPRCSLPKVVGPCRAAIPRYYFNTTFMECLPFRYGGCDANDNNFLTFPDCQKNCH